MRLLEPGVNVGMMRRSTGHAIAQGDGQRVLADHAHRRKPDLYTGLPS
jgi:hypothetical protein